MGSAGRIWMFLHAWAEPAAVKRNGRDAVSPGSTRSSRSVRSSPFIMMSSGKSVSLRTSTADLTVSCRPPRCKRTSHTTPSALMPSSAREASSSAAADLGSDSERRWPLDMPPGSPIDRLSDGRMDAPDGGRSSTSSGTGGGGGGSGSFPLPSTSCLVARAKGADGVRR